jgi:hypothetical protein
MTTPNSEHSTLYFDAPIANFHTTDNSEQALMSSIASPRSSSPNVLGNGNGNALNNSNVSAHNEIIDENEPITAHPNGSAGWLPATDLPDDTTTANNTNANGGRSNGSILKRNSVMQRARSVASRSMAESVGKKSIFTNTDGRAVSGSTFINGAGTTGPNAAAEADESLKLRQLAAEETLTKKQKEKIKRSESASCVLSFPYLN